MPRRPPRKKNFNFLKKSIDKVRYTCKVGGIKKGGTYAKPKKQKAQKHVDNNRCRAVEAFEI